MAAAAGLRDDETIARYLAAHRSLPAFTPFTLTDEAALWADLRRARERGYAVSEQETGLGACAIAAPTTRFVPTDRGRNRAAAVEAAGRLSAHLGYHPVA